MSTSAELRIQEAVYRFLVESELKVHPDDVNVVPVYDHVPQDAPLPFITIGEATAADWSTDTEQGSEHVLVIHTWAEAQGRAVVKRLQELIHEALDRGQLMLSATTPTIPHDADEEDPETWVGSLDVEWEFSESFMDPDGVTHHGVQRFRVNVEG